MSQALYQWIDSHTHLNGEYPFSVDEYLKVGREAGVIGYVTIGTVPGEYDRLQAFADQYPEVYFTVGVHPHEAKDYTPAVRAELLKFSRHAKCLAIGEIGLDYYYEHSDPAAQTHALKDQLELALEARKPVVIHARDAEEELIPFLADFSQRCGLSQGPGIIHCFSGTRKFGEECLKLGYYLSLSGILTFKTAEEIRQTAAAAPLERVLLETDAPWLAPVPYRGKPNQSSYMIETAKVLARVKGVSLEELSRATVTNTQRVFGVAFS